MDNKHYDLSDYTDDHESLDNPVEAVVSADYWKEEKIKLHCDDCGILISAKENRENIGDCNSCWDDKYLVNK